MAKNNVDRVDMVPACQDLVIILKSFFIGTQCCVGTEAVVVITNCVKREREGGRESSVARGPPVLSQSSQVDQQQSLLSSRPAQQTTLFVTY